MLVIMFLKSRVYVFVNLLITKLINVYAIGFIVKSYIGFICR